MDNFNSTLLIKNIPKSISDITHLLPTVPKETKSFGRRRVLLTYDTEATAQVVLRQLQQLEVAPGKRLNVAFFRKNEKPCANTKTIQPIRVNKTTQTNLHTAGETAAPQISKYVSKLYACNSKLNFEQPPPPYLKYAYPRITPDTLDSISIALMSNTRFYTQVLHLMNRMNLEPPFGAKPAGVRLTRGWPRDACTQTVDGNEDMPGHVEGIAITETDKAEESENKRRHVEEITITEAGKAEDSESELESAEEDERITNKAQVNVQVQKKRKEIDELEKQYKKKARLLLRATLHQQRQSTQGEPAASSCNKPTELQNVFEMPETAGKGSKIEMKLQPQKSKKSVEAFVPPTDLTAERLTIEHLQELPIYKNYQVGAPSNKLYIKNLAKDVSEEDLKQLYARYVAAEHLEVKVMQQGRMKGQAFVTFNSLSEVDVAAVLAKALTETNGFLLRQKPMVVCYGKK